MIRISDLLTEKEEKVFRKLSTPGKIQDFLDTLPVNFEKKGDTNFTVRKVLRENKAHCMEGALLAAAALWFHGEPPLLLYLQAAKHDDDHVVALFKKNGYWGAVSKTNHAVLRFRDPIYKTIRELALSYYHEYFLNKNGEKTLQNYSRPFSLKRYGTDWITGEEDTWKISDALEASARYPFVSKKNRQHIRRASMIERKAGELREWKRSDPRT